MTDDQRSQFRLFNLIKSAYVRENDLPQTEHRCGLKLVSGINIVSLHYRRVNAALDLGLTGADMAGQVVQPVVVPFAGPALEEPLVVCTCTGCISYNLNSAHFGRSTLAMGR